MVSDVFQNFCLVFVNEFAMFGFKCWLQLAITSRLASLLYAFFQTSLANEWGCSSTASMGDQNLVPCR